MKGNLWIIGEAFGGEEVALRKSGEDRYDVYYCWKKLGVMDLSDPPVRGKVGLRFLTERRKSRQTENDLPNRAGQNV